MNHKHYICTYPITTISRNCRLLSTSSQCGATAERLRAERSLRIPLRPKFFPLGKESNRPCHLAQFDGIASHHQCSPSWRAPVYSTLKTSTWCLHWGRKLQSRQWSALSSRCFASSKSQGVGKWAPAAMRSNVYKPKNPLFLPSMKQNSVHWISVCESISNFPAQHKVA